MNTEHRATADKELVDAVAEWRSACAEYSKADSEWRDKRALDREAQELRLIAALDRKSKARQRLLSAACAEADLIQSSENVSAELADEAMARQM